MNQETSSRTKTQRNRILNELRLNGDNGVTNITLSSIALRYNARLQELYQQGYKIHKDEMSGGVTKYVLQSEPEKIKGKAEDALSLLIKDINNTYDGVVRSEDLLKILEDNRFTVRRKIGSYN